MEPSFSIPSTRPLGLGAAGSATPMSRGVGAIMAEHTAKPTATAPGDNRLQASFPGILADATGATGRAGTTVSAEGVARKTAEEFVAVTLVQPVLAQLRATNQAWGPFAPGAYEKQFGPLLDAEVAVRMTRASNFPLVEAVTRSLLKSHGVGAEGAVEAGRPAVPAKDIGSTGHE